MTHKTQKIFQKESGLLFKNEDLLEEALTHSSYAKQYKRDTIKDNERLEFFGDAVLKLIVSEYLIDKYKEFDEGRLTKLRARIISDKTLAVLAATLKLGQFLRFSYGEKNTGGSEKESNLANALEAILGAYYIDQGYSKVKDFFIQLVESHDQDWLALDFVSDYKTKLQEILQRHKLDMPDYNVIGETGPDHDKEFEIEIQITENNMDIKTQGLGPSKKVAEQMAAQKALEELKKISPYSETIKNYFSQ